jgi:cysteine desulfurase / selenocysteine lyase
MLMLDNFDLAFDWREARNQTTACEGIVHFNNAGAALMPDRVVSTAIDYLRLEARCGGYEAEEMSRKDIAAVYASAARLLGCKPGEISIVENASRAWSLAFHSIGFAAGDVVLTTEVEYANNFIAMLHAERTVGIRVVIVPSDESGSVSLEQLAALIDEHGQRARVVSLTHVPTNGGLVNPAHEVGLIVAGARQSGALRADALFMLDACQSVGQIEVDVDAIGCDVLTTCSRKYLRGPRGLGILYVRAGVLDPAGDGAPVLLDVRAAHWASAGAFEVYTDSRRFETWESSNASKLALGIAIETALALDMAQVEAYVGHLAEGLRQRLRRIAGVEVQDLGSRRCGLVSFTVKDRDPLEVKAFLARDRINISVSERALTRIDMERRGLDSIARASIHYYNSEAEIDRFAERLDAFRFSNR